MITDEQYIYEFAFLFPSTSVVLVENQSLGNGHILIS